MRFAFCCGCLRRHPAWIGTTCFYLHVSFSSALFSSRVHCESLSRGRRPRAAAPTPEPWRIQPDTRQGERGLGTLRAATLAFGERAECPCGSHVVTAANSAKGPQECRFAVLLRSSLGVLEILPLLIKHRHHTAQKCYYVRLQSNFTFSLKTYSEYLQWYDIPAIAPCRAMTCFPDRSSPSSTPINEIRSPSASRSQSALSSKTRRSMPCFFKLVS